MTALPPPVSGHFGLDPTAVMGRRIGAYLIDAVIAWAVMAAVFWSVSNTVPNSPLISCTDDDAPTLCFELGDTIRFAEGGDANMVTVSGLVVWAIFGIVIQGLTGGTPGKLMVGLRVIRQDDGRLAGIGRCAARTVLWLVDAFPYILPLVGLITGLATKGHRRVGDMAAGTLVVRADAVGTPPIVPGLTAPAAGWSPPLPAGGPGGWVPPTAPPTQATPADFADPFARPAGQVFPAPDREEVPYGAPPPSGPPVASPPPVAAPPPAAPPPAAAPVATPPPPPQPRDDQPRWDPQRNAYVWFDPARNQWMIHDAATDQWLPM
ncbi:MAG: RDD family protein [Acidimicrobiales bacterium]